MKTWLVAIAVVLFPLALRAEPGAALEEEVRRVDDGRLHALVDSDLAALERLFSDSLVYIHANGRVDTKAGYLGMLRSGDIRYVSLKYDPAPVFRITGDTAVVTGRTQIEMKSKSGQITKRLLTTTTVYVRTDGRWRVVSYQGTPTN